MTGRYSSGRLVWQADPALEAELQFLEQRFPGDRRRGSSGYTRH